TASVLVQVLASAAETEGLLALAAASDLVAGVVGGTNLTSPAVADQIARLPAGPRGGPRARGPRPAPGTAEPGPGGPGRRPAARGRGAVGAAAPPSALLARRGRRPAALAVTGALGDVRFVLDHGAKPEIAHGRLEPWASLIRDLAARPNVVCKVSGLVTEAGP